MGVPWIGMLGWSFMPHRVSPVVESVRRLDDAFADVVGRGLPATYLPGSAALGGFVPGRSDVDVLFITGDDRFEHRVLHDAAAALRAAATPCPGRGVELSVVTAGAAKRPVAPWPFLLHVSTDPAVDKVVVGADDGGDRDLLMRFVACRAAGVVVRGPPPVELIGEIDRRDVLAYLDDQLGWTLNHTPEAYAVLNACRATQYLARGEIVSKVDGARYVIGRSGPQELIATALKMHTGKQPHRRPSDRVRSFVGEIGTRLRAESS